MKKVFVILAFLCFGLLVALPAVPHKEVRVLFVGDLFFDRYIRLVMQARGEEYPFSCIDGFLRNADLVVGNLEGPITNNASISAGSTVGSPENFHFTFAPTVATLLAEHNIKLVSIGNNHIMNFGREGLLQTKKYLTEAGVAYFGDEEIYRIEINRVPLSFINYNEFGSVPAEETAEMIAGERAAEREVIVYAHWGEEYAPVLPRVRQLAHSFIDAGAGAVLGSHPHIVQEHEIYKGKHIYYSLGNFIFDQYWNDEVSRGLSVLATISKNDISVQEYGVRMLGDGRTCLLVQ